MVKRLLDAVMEKRARRLTDDLRALLPAQGSILDVGSGTGHLAASLISHTQLDVVTSDVSDIHVVGPRPLLLADGSLPFVDDSFSAALLVFMLGYPKEPAEVLREARRVTRGPIVLVQSIYVGPIGFVCFRIREFFWTFVAFHASRLAGYVPRHASFAMRTRRFYTEAALLADISAAGLRVRSRRDRAILPGGRLFVAICVLERHD